VFREQWSTELTANQQDWLESVVAEPAEDARQEMTIRNSETAIPQSGISRVFLCNEG
jgi:hypothetical protein